ncbi:hypothetical protein [Streptomyces sp. bgisy095]|uniref:hypothetical protein n=1 Tax=unclassified Streptomyces TaxID=2593676 RepID=UPI003D712855
MVGNASRAAIIGDRRITGLSTNVLAELAAELGSLWRERHQARLVSRLRKRAVGAGAKTGWCSPTGFWPRSCTSGMPLRTTCSPRQMRKQIHDEAFDASPPTVHELVGGERR